MLHVPVCLRSDMPRELLLYETVYMGHTLLKRYVIFDQYYHMPQGTWEPHYKKAVPGETPIISGPARQKQVTRDSDKRQEK